MKKVVLASLLAVAGAGPLAHCGFAQTAPAATPQAGGQVQMSQEEYAAYNNANTQATPAAKAAAFEAYLKAYPQSAVKADVLQQLLFAYSQSGDSAKTLDAADRLLQVDPNNLRALTFETYTRRTAADALTDPAAKAAGLDVAAGYAQKGLVAEKPKDMSDADFKALQANAFPVFQNVRDPATSQPKPDEPAILDLVELIQPIICANPEITRAVFLDNLDHCFWQAVFFGVKPGQIILQSDQTGCRADPQNACVVFVRRVNKRCGGNFQSAIAQRNRITQLVWPGLPEIPGSAFAFLITEDSMRLRPRTRTPAAPIPFAA